MPDHQSRSFAALAVEEATARRLRVDLVLKRVRPGTPNRLISRFLGLQSDGELVLDVPGTTRGKKVFVPDGWPVGMAFELGGQWMQARTAVLGHTMFRLYPTRRVDGLVVQRPAKILSVRRSRKPRYPVDPSQPFVVALWPVESLAAEQFSPIQIGQLANWSEGGLGVRLREPLELRVGSRLAIHVHKRKTEECLLLWGILKHCTADEDGYWIAGFGDVATLGPGEAVGLIRALVAPTE